MSTGYSLWSSMQRTTVIKVLGSIILLGTSIGVVHYFDLTQFLSGDSLRSLVEGYGVLAPLVFIIVYAIATVALVPGSALTLAGGALFGPLLGTTYTVIGAFFGATLAFFFARYLRGGRPLARTGKWTSLLASYDARIQTRGLATVLFLRLVPLFPFSALNYGLGLTSVKVRHYLIGTLIGIIPGTFAFTYFGDALSTLRPVPIIGAVILIIVITLLGRNLLKRYGQTDT